MGASRRPARPHEQTGVRHMQARRNPSPAATKSRAHAGVRVQRQPVRYSRLAPERYLSGYKRGAAARPVSHTLIKSARREQPQLNYLQYMRRSRTSAQSVCSPAGSESAGFVAAPSTECGQPRQAWSDEAAQILKSHEKVHSTVRVRVPGQNVCICATAIERTDKVVRTLRRAGGRCLSGERRTNSSVGRESTRTTTRQCNYRYRDAKAASCMCLMHADGDKQRGCTNFWSFVVLQHGRAVRFDADLTESSSCRGCTWMFVRVFLAASRLQLRSPGRIRTAHEPSWSRSEGGWNEGQNEHPIESSRVDLVSPCVRARRTIHRTWHLAQRSPPSNSYRKRR